MTAEATASQRYGQQPDGGSHGIVVEMKPKTEPQCPERHKRMVPLRVVAIKIDRLPEAIRESHDQYVSVGDIMFVLSDRFSRVINLFNCTKDSMIPSRLFDNGAILCLRAYDVGSIILSNDNEPAPVI